MEKIQVGVAMSGGVDSTSSVLMLKEHYNVTGFFMQLAQPQLSQQIEHVTALAVRIGIPLQIIDLTSQFEEKVLHYFSQSYFSGNTPNPCMVCNEEIKFGLFLETIIAAGMVKAATGHYARITEKNGIFYLRKGRDPRKDQSYFLSRLNQQQLARVLFPLGEMLKTDIYNYAEGADFHDFRGKESQDVCFLENESVGEFLRLRFPQSLHTGAVKTLEGKTIGSHKGLYYYTIGQRRGLGIPDTTPYYVVRLDPSTNSVIVGKEHDLLCHDIYINTLHWIAGMAPDLGKEYQVRIRYSHKGSAATLIRLGDDLLRLHFQSCQRAVTPGQFAVIYDNDLVVGSGVILPPDMVEF